jgi:DNA polymerase-4
MPSTVCHVDMDAFFAAIEVRAAPHLRDLPLVVGGGPGDRGVVTTASYPARRFGIRSGMSLREARARCSDLLCLPVDPAKYVHASERLLRILERFTPAVEPASIDEAFLDLSGLNLGPPAALETARRIKTAIWEDERLTCSIGLGDNKLVAKMATGLEKPDGLVQILPGDFEKHFWPRPTIALWGVGPETSRTLELYGVRTIGELAAADEKIMERLFGVSGRVLVRLARGIGGGPVVPYFEGAPHRSMGHETTFPGDVMDTRILESQLLLLADKLARRMRREGYAGHVVSLRIKWSDGTAVSRQKALAVPTDQEGTILAQARSLLRSLPGGRPVRLIGVSVGHLLASTNLYPLFPEDQKRRELSLVKDRLRNRFGESAIMPLGVLPVLRP